MTEEPLFRDVVIFWVCVFFQMFRSFFAGISRLSRYGNSIEGQKPYIKDYELSSLTILDEQCTLILYSIPSSVFVALCIYYTICNPFG